MDKPTRIELEFLLDESLSLTRQEARLAAFYKIYCVFYGNKITEEIKEEIKTIMLYEKNAIVKMPSIHFQIFQDSLCTPFMCN